jgi:hypothetical protein
MSVMLVNGLFCGMEGLRLLGNAIKRVANYKKSYGFQAISEERLLEMTESESKRSRYLDTKIITCSTRDLAAWSFNLTSLHRSA